MSNITAESKLQGFRRIKANHQAECHCQACGAWCDVHRKVCKACKQKALVIIDASTACRVVQVYDGINEANKAKYIKLGVVKMAEVAWKL